MQPQKPITTLTLDELLASRNTTVQRHAMGILKELLQQRIKEETIQKAVARNS